MRSRTRSAFAVARADERVEVAQQLAERLEVRAHRARDLARERRRARRRAHRARRRRARVCRPRSRRRRCHARARRCVAAEHALGRDAGRGREHVARPCSAANAVAVGPVAGGAAAAVARAQRGGGPQSRANSTRVDRARRVVRAELGQRDRVAQPLPRAAARGCRRRRRRRRRRFREALGRGGLGAQALDEQVRLAVVLPDRRSDAHERRRGRVEHVARSRRRRARGGARGSPAGGARVAAAAVSPAVVLEADHRSSSAVALGGAQLARGARARRGRRRRRRSRRRRRGTARICPATRRRRRPAPTPEWYSFWKYLVQKTTSLMRCGTCDARASEARMAHMHAHAVEGARAVERERPRGGARARAARLT